MAIPTGVQIFCFIATILAGRVINSVPMLFITGAFAIFVLGGLTGVMVALAPFDFQVHDSYFIVAHLHYVLVGGAIFPIVAGFYYYYPMVRARQLDPRLGRVAFWLMFFGFNLAFFPMHIAGLLGMARRVYTYPADQGLEIPNLLSTVGALVLAAGLAVFLWDLLRPRPREPYAPRNLWNAGTLEWVGEMPSQPWGVRSIPPIKSRYPLWDQPHLIRDMDAGRFYLPDAEEGQRETLVTTTIDAQPIQCLRVPGPTFVTLLAALFTGGLFILATFHLWIPALVSGVLALGAILYWVWTGTALIPEKPEKDVGLGLTLPLYASGPSSVGWWAMFITMLGDMTAFAGLVFGYFFYWTIHDDFPPAHSPGPGVEWPLAGAALLLASWLLTLFARTCNRRDWALAFHGVLGTAALLALAGAAALFAGPWRAGLDPTAHVYGAIVWVLVLWVLTHVAIGVVMQLFCLAARVAGRLTGRFDIHIQNVGLYWHFLAVTVVVTVAVLAGFPMVAR